ncbi:MAG: hypothetical protein N838_14880 [Thiohalocapsa sp. PB-PSB1]|nr:MAG: hypothetical protein N838_14880 [Thiohalocapsa sp. PB-PSB1]
MTMQNSEPKTEPCQIPLLNLPPPLQPQDE